MKNQKKKFITQKDSSGNLKPNLLKITALAVALSISVGVTFPSFAKDQSTADVEVSDLNGLSANGNVSSASATDIVAEVQNVKDEATNCADPANVNGLAHAQAKTLNDMKAMILTPINTDTIFSTASKGGCFDALKNFPNLSASIPSLSGIADSLKKTLLRYATRKVCTAVNDALEEVIEPINEVISEVTKNGEIDLTGELNKKMADELYKIDPELGRVSVGASEEYNWELGDVFNDSGTGGNNSGDIVVDSPSDDSKSDPVTPAASGSFVTNGGELSNQQKEAKNSEGVADSVSSFLKSIF